MKKFEVDYEQNLKDLKKINIRKNYMKLIIINIIIVLVFSIGLLPPDPITLGDYIITCLFFIINIFLIFNIVESIQTTILYKKKNLNCKLVFTDNTLEKITNEETRIINYGSIDKIKELVDSILIIVDRDTIFKIKKELLSDEEIEFIKEIDINKKILLKKNVKLLKSDDKKFKKIKLLMLILFICTIITLWIAFFTVLLITSINDGNMNNTFENMWIMYLFLPIPLLSIILGIKYKRVGIKCKKNIVAGFIIAILLIIYGSFTNIYKTIDTGEPFNREEYEKFIRTDLPKNGVFQRIEWNSSYLENHISNFIDFENNEELRNFNEFIKNSDEWNLYDNLSSSLEIFLTPFKKINNEECYYFIYIKELNLYNELPKESGVYSIISMEYDLNNSQLQIEEFKYNYKK